MDALRPQLVVFCSALSWRVAKRSGLLNALRATGVAVRAAAHPASAWWHKPSRRLKDRSGRESFLAALGEVMTPSTWP
ncbi:hypothetical protein [Pseudomonas mangiferae]|uniref:Uracil-DNA glycosylase-like domain-containing protein n=1 Tax=Pseudomonas mangiferae TaxID=2593654 RepID=A0A553GU40_9PSED|nr:hypothetical protein [Pseudomonas mangiferae]TRX73010.1 hypothetical protein FM069_20020 [Pseudomonas mangiferae]